MTTAAPPFEYEDYMQFEIIEANPWTAEYLREHLRGLGVQEPDVAYIDVEEILLCYDQSPNNRSYHGPDHGAFVGQPDVPPALAARLSGCFPVDQARSILAIAGLFHDVAYKHVDEINQEGARAWPTVLKDRLGDTVTYTRTVENDKPVFRTFITEAGKNDPTTQLVAHLFDVGEEGIIHNQGGNEFDSALAAARFLLEKGTPLKSIIAVVAAIAATVPFKRAIEINEQGHMTDGHMGALAEKVSTLLVDTEVSSSETAWQDTNDIMYLSVHLANRDISPFVQPDNFAQVVHGGRGVKAEEVPALRAEVKTIRQLARAAGLQRSAPLLYGWLSSKDSPVPSANVPHIYIPRDEKGRLQGSDEAYPPLDVYRQAAEHTERNSHLANQYFIAHELGIVLAAAIATHIGEPDALVPGIVHAINWHPGAVAPRIAEHSDDDRLVYNELLYGTGQRAIDAVTSRRSPLGAILFGSLGSEGASRLSEKVQEIRQHYSGEDPFSDPVVATAFIDDVKGRIGVDVFSIIITELHRVARYYQDDSLRGNPGRAQALEALSDGLAAY